MLGSNPASNALAKRNGIKWCHCRKKAKIPAHW